MKVLFFLLFALWLWADVITPYATLKTNGAISDMVIVKGKLYASTDEGIINVFDAKIHKKLSSIELPKIKDDKGVAFRPKIYSMDHLDGSTVIAAESGGEFRDIYLHNHGTLTKIADSRLGLMVKKVRFLDAGHILMGLSSDTIVAMDLVSKKILYKVQAGGGVFSDMELSDFKDFVAVGDESGEIVMMRTDTGKIVKTLRGINLDAINRLDYASNTIIAGGHDRRVGVYRKGGSYFIDTEFFAYAVGLNSDATLGVYSDGEENELQLIEIATQKKLARFKGGEVIYDRLLFVDKHTLIGCGEENKIYYWRIP